MKYILLALLACLNMPAFAQHMHSMKMEDSSMNGMNSIGTMNHMDMNMPGMSSSFSRNLTMSRDGSGTSWLPDAAPIYAYMVHSKKWMYMFHGNIFLRYNKQDIGNKGTRGGDQFDAPNMLGAMGQRQIGKNGLFHFGAMVSLDRLTEGGNGYPLLFQTGESWNGKPLVDRQHPHDLLSELAVSYAYSFSKKADAFIYIGYPGEPALGPVTFMHRPSGMNNPDAPIAHHWEDAMHITFGVATLGFRYGKFRLEGSSFTGRELDENRYNFDKPRFDSWSGRLSFNPNAHWALQVSHGFIKSPEELHPLEDVNRTTASATYSYPFHEKSFLSVTALWGMNKIKDEDASNAALLEANLRMNKLIVYGRYEWVQKSGEELNILINDLYSLNAFTLGASYDLIQSNVIRMALGAQGTLYHAPEVLSFYGHNPLAGEVYLHFYPPLMKRMQM